MVVPANSERRGTMPLAAAAFCAGLGGGVARWRHRIAARRQGDLGLAEYRGQGGRGVDADEPVGLPNGKCQLPHVIEVVQ